MCCRAIGTDTKHTVALKSGIGAPSIAALQTENIGDNYWLHRICNSYFMGWHIYVETLLYRLWRRQSTVHPERIDVFIQYRAMISRRRIIWLLPHSIPPPQ
jgi:hypothetical protein